MRRIIFPRVSPRWYQMDFWRAFDSGSQYNIISWPRRAGKDVTSFSAMVNRALTTPGNYYYLFPTRAWAQRALWDNICEWGGGRRLVDLLCPPEIVARKNNSDFFIDLHNGSRIKIDGTDNLNFVGQGGSGYVLSEYSLHKDEVFGFLAPILTEGGAWVIANGTMRGKRNMLYQLYEKNKDRANWYTQWLTLADTKTNYWINEEEDLRINEDLVGLVNPLDGKPYKNIQEDVDSGIISFSLARQEYLNRADGDVAGGYYGYEIKAMHKRGGVKPFDATKDRVYTFWDLGGTKEDSDDTCILFAHINEKNGEARVVDFYRGRGKLRGHYWNVVNSKGYEYAGHYYPHDGKKTNEWTGETGADTARNEFGVEVRFIPKTQSTMNDIEVCRRGFAKTEFADNAAVDELIQDLSSYHENESTGRPCHKQNCDICGGASHSADTFRYMRMAIHLGLVEPYIETRSKQWHVDMEVDDEWMLV